MMLATVLPMIALLAWLLPALAVAWRRSCLASRAGLVLLWLAGSFLLLMFPHEDGFTGLDNTTYRIMSHAFLEGRGFHDSDEVLAQVPAKMREDFMFHRGPVGRPTRDRVFQLSGWQGTDSEPFFLPMLPLAAAGLDPVMDPERFVPLMGALMLALILAVGFCSAGGWGLIAVMALLLGTAWPAWYLRGFYAEAVGAVLVGAVVVVSSVRLPSRRISIVAGLALGLAISYHPTLSMLSVPVLLALTLESGERANALRMLGGFVAGLVPFLAVNHFVCRPYGDLSSWKHISQIAAVAPEHRAMAIVAVMLLVIGVFALCLWFLRRKRLRIACVGPRMWLTGWILLCVLPCILLVAPGGVGSTISEGAMAMWSGIRWPFGLLVLFGIWSVLQGNRPIRERFLIVVLLWAVAFFMFLKGVEKPVGLWSQRRFVPVILLGIALLAAPLSKRLLASVTRLRWRGWSLAIVMGVAGLWNLANWPVAYCTVNERGATEWTHAVSERLGTNRWIIFDYYPHSVPYAADLKQKVLGLGEPSRAHWPEVADWINALVESNEVWVATSWEPCMLEDGFQLEEVFAKTGSFPVVKTKAYFPAEPGARVVENHFMAVLPLSRGEAGAQFKVMDGGPVGLRGPWGRKSRHIVGPTGLKLPATWSREGSGIVGPVPLPGQMVKITIDAAASRADGEAGQVLKIMTPWGGEDALLAISNTFTRVSSVSSRPAGQVDGGEKTGIYLIYSANPYDPAKAGITGFAKDLGAVIHSIRIECLTSNNDSEGDGLDRPLARP